MSRRPTDNIAQNKQTIKNLLKLESNKRCADCKEYNRPRWASWNLGVFVCIKCSGLHRGMGTHISRVKSVDLDDWKDEQAQSILKWGNARANKYWEAKLAPGHVPKPDKMENFIRTKYESKKWVMDGPMPDPSTLGTDGDDDVPLNTVQAKARLDRSASQRLSSAPNPAVRSARPPQATASFDLMGGDPENVPPRASTAQPQPTRPLPPQNPAASLLGGLDDMLGGTSSRPSSANSKPTDMSRAQRWDSILSMYSKPASQPAPQPQAAQSREVLSASGVQSAGGGGALGGMNDAFSGLNFGSSAMPTASAPPTMTPHSQKPAFSPAPKPQAANPNAYGALTSVMKPAGPTSQMTSTGLTSPPPLSGGSFFDSKPSVPPKPTPAPITLSQAPLTVRKASNASDGFGDFSSALSSPAPRPTTTSSSGNGLLDFTSPAANAGFAPPPSKPTAPASTMDGSVFNLSASKPSAVPKPAAPSAGLSNFGASDPWGGNEWGTPDPAPAPVPSMPASMPTPKAPATTTAASNDFGWGAPNDWNTSSAPSITTSAPTKLADLSSDPWGASSPVAATNSGFDSGDFGGMSVAPARPTIAAEEDFGGWSNAAVDPSPVMERPIQRQDTQAKPAGNSEDLFGNVWG